MDDITRKHNSQQISPSAKLSHEESISRLENTLSLDDDEAQCYKENFATIRKLLIGSSDFSIAVSPQGETIIKIGDIPFIMDDISIHNHEHTIKTGGHQYYELNRLKKNYEKDLPTYEEWLKAKEISGSVDSLISIINGAGNGFISKNTTTHTTKTYATGFSFHPFQGEDIYGQYICKRFANNATKFVPIHGENFVSCKRVYRGDMATLEFRPIADTDILGYTAKDGVLDVCYTTEQYVKRLNDQVYEAYLRHKPFEDFYTNLTIASPELQKECMTNLFLVMLSQYSPYETHISEVITYAKTYFTRFNIPTAHSEKFFKNIFSSQIGFAKRFSEIIGLNNKVFSLLKERISDLQDEYPEYDFKELVGGKNMGDTSDYYDKKNIALGPRKQLLAKEWTTDKANGKIFPYIYSNILEATKHIYQFVDDAGNSIMPYIKIVFDNRNAAVISRQELKCLDMRCLQIYASMGAMQPINVDSYQTFTLVTNDNELLIDKYSVGKILLPTDTLPDIAYLPTQDDIVQFCDRLKTNHDTPWKAIIEIIMRAFDSIIADPKNVFDLRQIYVPCKEGGVIIAQDDGIQKVEKKPEDTKLLVALIKNIVPSHQETTTRVNTKKRVDTLHNEKRSIKRYQLVSKKDIKQEQEAILAVLRTHHHQEKKIQYNPQLSGEFARKTQYIDIEDLPFTSAEQILANLDIHKTTQRKRSMEHTEILMKAGYTATVLENMHLFHEGRVCISVCAMKDWNTVLPLLKKFSSLDHQKKILHNAFVDIGSKIADFIDYLPEGILTHFELSAILQNPEYNNINRTKYRKLCGEFLSDEIDISYIRLLGSVEEIIRVLPVVESIDTLGFSFFGDWMKKDNRICPIVLERFSEFSYRDTMNVLYNQQLFRCIEGLQSYCKEDNFLAKIIRKNKDTRLIVKILETHVLENIDQSFLLDILQRIGLEPQAILADHDKEDIDQIYETRLSDFVGPLSIAIVDECTKQGHVGVVLDNIDKFVPLPDNYFSDDGAKKLIKEKGIETFSKYSIKYFHNLSPEIAEQIHASDDPEKYKVLYENRTSFSSFPAGFLSKEDAKICLDTYGIDVYASYALYFDDIPSESLKTIYEDLYNKKEWKKIVKYSDYFLDYIPSGVYRSLQRHGYIKIIDTNAPDPTQQKQVKKYLAPQEFESMLMASVGQTITLPNQGKYIDGTKRINHPEIPSIILDDVIEEYDPLCMPYDYFYHDEDIKIDILDRSVYIIKRTRENGSSFGFDTIYLVDSTEVDKVYVKKIADSIVDQKYISIKAAHIEGENIVVELSTGEYKEAYEPIVNMRKEMKTIIEKKEEEKYIFSPIKQQVIVEMFLGEIKKEANFSNELAQRLSTLLKKEGGDTHVFIKKISDDVAYCAKYPDIVFRMINTCIDIITKFTQEESNMIGELLLHTVDWKRYARCPINYVYIKRIFSMNNEESAKKGNMLIDKLIEIYSSNFIDFAKYFGDDERIITRCIATEKFPPGFSLLVYKAKYTEGAAYLIKKRKETFFQDIIFDIKNASLQKNEYQNICRFYSDYIKKNNDEEQVKASLYLQILNQDKIMLDVAVDYLSIFVDDRGTGNTIQMLHYLYKVGALDKLQIPLISPDLLKDVVTFSATYSVPASYLQKITEDMMQCLRDPSHTYTGDKELLTSALRFLLTLVPDTVKYFTTYAQAKKYPTASFISTVYTPFA